MTYNPSLIEINPKILITMSASSSSSCRRSFLEKNCVKKLWFSPVIDAVSTCYLALCELAGNTFVLAFKSRTTAN